MPAFAPNFPEAPQSRPERGLPKRQKRAIVIMSKGQERRNLILKNNRFEKMGTKTAPEAGRQDRIRNLVAGAGFEPATFGL